MKPHLLKSQTTSSSQSNHQPRPLGVPNHGFGIGLAGLENHLHSRRGRRHRLSESQRQGRQVSVEDSSDQPVEVGSFFLSFAENIPGWLLRW